MAKLRNRIELNKTNKQACGQLDILCADYKETEQKLKAIKTEFETIKENIKGYVSSDADYFTTQYKLVVSIQPKKTEFKYDIDKILKAYPEIAENLAFGEFKEKAEVKTLKSIEKLEK